MYSWETPTPERVNSVIAMQDVSRYCFRTCLCTMSRDTVTWKRKIAVSFC